MFTRKDTWRDLLTIIRLVLDTDGFTTSEGAEWASDGDELLIGEKLRHLTVKDQIREVLDDFEQIQPVHTTARVSSTGT